MEASLPGLALLLTYPPRDCMLNIYMLHNAGMPYYCPQNKITRAATRSFLAVRLHTGKCAGFRRKDEGQLTMEN